MDEFDGSNGRWRIESVIHQAIAKFRNQPGVPLNHLMTVWQRLLPFDPICPLSGVDPSGYTQ